MPFRDVMNIRLISPPKNVISMTENPQPDGMFSS